MVARRARTKKQSVRVVAARRAIGEQVRATRHEQRLTLEAAAERADLDIRHLQKVEAGSITTTIGTLVRIADGLHVLPGVLLATVPKARTRLSVSSADADERTARRPLVTRVNPATKRPSSRTMLGTGVAAIRAERGWTQAQLAELASMPQQHVQRIEAGLQNVTLDTLDRIAKALEVDASTLFLPRKRG